MGKLGHGGILCIFISGMPRGQNFTKKKKIQKDTLVSLRTVASAEPSLLFLDQPALRVHRTGTQPPEVTVSFLRAINKGMAVRVIKGNLNFLPSFLCAVKNPTGAIFPETA